MADEADRERFAGLGMLASALAGRPVAVAPVDGVGPPWTDGQTVFVDAECYHKTRSIAFIRALAHHGDCGDAIAHSVATFMLGANQTGPSRQIAEKVGQ